MAKELPRDGYHVVNGKQTDKLFHQEDLTDKKEKEFIGVINKLYRIKQ